jgi:toxin ParE1/3/4
MPRILRRPEAENDLDEIWWFIAQDSPNNADKFLDRLQEICLVLAEFPQMGAKRDELVTALRSHAVGNYLVFYFPLDDGIDIVRVLQGSRSIESIF